MIARHPGKEHTLTMAHTSYFWPTMHIDIDMYVPKCVRCAQVKGAVPRPAPILEYPSPDWPWDLISTDLLQLPASHQGCKCLLICVDHLSQYVILVPLKDKSTKSFAHALVTHLFCTCTTPQIMLSDNGMEFHNHLLEEISKEFGVKHCFTVIYHPVSNSLVEHTNRKILEVFHLVIGESLETWEDWLPQVAASINSSVCESMGQSPHFILFGVKKQLQCELLSSSHTPVYNIDDYVKCQIKIFSNILKLIKHKLIYIHFPIDFQLTSILSLFQSSIHVFIK